MTPPSCRNDGAGGGVADAMGTFQQTEIAAANPQPQPDYLGDEYLAPIPGTTEEMVYRQYYIPYCLSVGVKPAPFLRWLDLSRIIDKSSVEILAFVAPDRLDRNLAQPSWRDD